jgi:hypothetical protein
MLMLLLLFTEATTRATAPRAAPPTAAMRKARDPNIAVEQELCAARAQATAAAYDLFIARHPRHPLAAIARKERAALVAGLKRGD